MRIRLGLRWKILILTVLAPVALAIGTLWTMNSTVSGHQQDSIDESLRRSSSVFENMMSERARALEVAAAVIVRDPRFFSILTLPASPSDPQYRATVRGVAKDFHAITRSDLFEVLDRNGNLIASVGRGSSSAKSRSKRVLQALRGRAQTGILVEKQAHFQVTTVPVLAGGGVVGALLVGADIGGPLASRLRTLTQADVTFISGTTITGSTLNPRSRSMIRDAMAELAMVSRQPAGNIIELHGDSETWLTLVRTIPGSVPGQRQLYVMQRSLDIETAFLTGVQATMLQLFSLAALFAVLMGFLVAQRITRPVNRLVRGAEEMEKGNYDFPLDIRSEDEIGYLADRFRVMREREKHYVNQLEDVARQKSEFIAIASHELRTPISVIKGYVELFSTGGLGPTTEEQGKGLAAIDRGVLQLTKIAEDATRYAQMESERLNLSLEDHEVAQLTQDALAAAALDAPNRNVTLSSVVEPGLPTARVDGARLVQAIANLVRNGIRFTPDGGTVEVCAERAGDQLQIVVRDTGVGIPPERLDHVWERSYSTSDSMHHHSSAQLEFQSAGLGLGLPLVLRIVKAHGGAVRADSTQGKGSVFTIRVPYRGDDRLERAA
jgi:signal transduction histidine kinase